MTIGIFVVSIYLFKLLNHFYSKHRVDITEIQILKGVPTPDIKEIELQGDVQIDQIIIEEDILQNNFLNQDERNGSNLELLDYDGLDEELSNHSFEHSPSRF
jgi:hypothetical protein